MKDDALSALSSEFQLWGVKFTTTNQGNSHIKLHWQVSPYKDHRSYTIARTPSDWRGTLNARAHIRRLFKADGLTLKQDCAKPKPILEKALSMPEPVEKDIDQIKMLRAEVADLTELVLELASFVSTIRDTVVPKPAPTPPSSIVLLAPPVISKKKNRSIKAIEHVTEAWKSTDDIARDMGLSPNLAYRKLYYLTKKNLVELSRGSWRRKPTHVLYGGVVKKEARSNGRHI